MMDIEQIKEMAQALATAISSLELEEKVEALNHTRLELHKVSPFQAHPVDYVRWEKQGDVAPNNYNPNSVAPPEMKLLERSILADGYTQPIVGFDTSTDDSTSIEVTDGFHRWTTGVKSKKVGATLHGYIPIVAINELRPDMSRAECIASTIRHNRARGSHAIDLMQSIVVELKDVGMSDQWIMKNIGMDSDELLRMKQTSGLAHLFANEEFSSAWVKDEDETGFY